MAADLKVAIAGHGVVGQRRQDFISQNRHARVVAICDRNYSGQEGVRDGIAYCANYQRMLEQPYDVLFVCVPNFLAPEITIAGLEHGCHVFCEKPPGRGVRDLVPVIATERRRPAQKLDVEDEVRALMTNNNGVSVGLLSSANLHDHTFSLRVVLEGGEYQLSGILSSTRSYGEELLTTIVPRENGGGHPDKQTRAFVRDESWSLEIAEFMEA